MKMSELDSKVKNHLEAGSLWDSLDEWANFKGEEIEAKPIPKEEIKVETPKKGVYHDFIHSIDPIDKSADISNYGYQKPQKVISTKKTGVKYSNILKASMYPQTEGEIVFNGNIPPKDFFEEKLVKKEKAPTKINKTEEIFLNYNELADELAQLDLVRVHGKYDELTMVDEYNELLNKYIKLILKYERNEE